MTDRMTEIRTRLDAWHGMEPVEQSLTHPDEYVADIAWLLDEIQMLYVDVDEAIRKGEDAADYWKQQFDSLRRQHKRMVRGAGEIDAGITAAREKIHKKPYSMNVTWVNDGRKY